MPKPFHVIATPDENGYTVTIPENPAGHHSTEQRENVKTKLLVSQQNFSVS